MLSASLCAAIVGLAWEQPGDSAINKALRGYKAVTLLTGVEERLFEYAETRARHAGDLATRPTGIRPEDLASVSRMNEELEKVEKPAVKNGKAD